MSNMPLLSRVLPTQECEKNGIAAPGAIVLLHSTSKTNAEILEELIEGWKEQGYSFASLEDLS